MDCGLIMRKSEVADQTSGRMKFPCAVATNGVVLSEQSQLPSSPQTGK
jgi:hypothetical protein